MKICRESVFLLIFLIDPSLTDVRLTLPTEIELGKPLKLDCETSSVIPATKSRQWRGGADNKLLCYDGTTVDPTKYKERIINQTNYELIVEKTSESDLRCPYACRVGFDIDQKFLEVNKNNFLQLPDEKFTKVDYQMQNGKYSLKIFLKKVFPKPECELKIKGEKINIPIANITESHVLLNVTFSLESSEAISPCSAQLDIECQIGRKKHLISSENSITCNPSQSSQDSKTPFVIPVVCVACILFGLGVTLVLLKRRKRNNKNNDGNNKQNGQDYAPLILNREIRF